MKLGLLAVAAVTMLGCVGPATSRGASTVTVCTAHNARGVCTEFEERENDMARWARERSEEHARQEASRRVDSLMPAIASGR